MHAVCLFMYIFVYHFLVRTCARLLCYAGMLEASQLCLGFSARQKMFLIGKHIIVGLFFLTSYRFLPLFLFKRESNVLLNSTCMTYTIVSFAKSQPPYIIAITTTNHCIPIRYNLPFNNVWVIEQYDDSKYILYFLLFKTKITAWGFHFHA